MENEMRLKNVEGPLSVRNGNNDVINSPKRINTIQNSNVVTSNSYLTSSSDQDCLDNSDVITLETSRLNNIDNSKVQWCTPKVELTNNANNRLFNINNTLAISLANNARHGTASSVCSESSPDDSLLDYEEAHQSCSSVDTSPQEEEEDRGFDITDSESEEGNVNTIHRRGIVNPNYPGFQHLAHTLDYNFKSCSDSEEDDYDSRSKLDAEANSINNNNNDSELSVNRLDSVENIQKVFYDKPVFNISDEINSQTVISTDVNEEASDEIASASNSYQVSSDDDESNINLKSSNVEQIDKELDDTVEKLNTIDFQVITKFNIECNVEDSFDKPVIVEKQIFDDSKTVIDAEMALIKTNFDLKLSDAFLSSVHDNIPKVDPDCFKKEVFLNCDSNRKNDNEVFRKSEEVEKFCKEELTKGEKEKDDDSTVPRKKEKMEFVKKRRDYSQHIGSLITIPRRDVGLRGKDYMNRRSLPLTKEKKRISPESLGGFDVYNIETAMPKIDLEAIESHLRAAREEERRRRTDREEIRRRLAMGNEEEYYNDRPGRKPSLQARLQSGMNLQICFMNETASDTESPSSDSECTLGKPKQPKTIQNNAMDSQNNQAIRPSSLPIGNRPVQMQTDSLNESDFFAKQARLQTEARMALAQAKEMARMQMEIERQRQKKSPITEMVRHSMEKVGIPFPEDRRRLSRQILTEMNVAQLQVIVNDLHTQIENLNEHLVKFLMDRDDLHMEQDSMLVDIEDLTRFLGAREQSVKEHNLAPSQNNNVAPPSPAPASPLTSLNNSVKPHLHRIASFVKK